MKNLYECLSSMIFDKEFIRIFSNYKNGRKREMHVKNEMRAAWCGVAVKLATNLEVWPDSFLNSIWDSQSHTQNIIANTCTLERIKKRDTPKTHSVLLAKPNKYLSINAHGAGIWYAFYLILFHSLHRILYQTILFCYCLIRCMWFSFIACVGLTFRSFLFASFLNSSAFHFHIAHTIAILSNLPMPHEGVCVWVCVQCINGNQNITRGGKLFVVLLLELQLLPPTNNKRMESLLIVLRTKITHIFFSWTSCFFLLQKQSYVRQLLLQQKKVSFLNFPSSSFDDQFRVVAGSRVIIIDFIHRISKTLANSHRSMLNLAGLFCLVGNFTFAFYVYAWKKQRFANRLTKREKASLLYPTNKCRPIIGNLREIY